MAQLVNFTIEGFTAEGHKAAMTFASKVGDVRTDVIDAMNQMWVSGIYPEKQAWVQRHEFEVCDTVVLRQKENGDGSFTPLFIMYPAATYLNRKFLHEYLDTPEQRTKIEELIGRKLDSLPVYTNSIYPERGKLQSEAKFFVKVRPFGVLKRIPEQGDSDETREKHRLVRYVSLNPDDGGFVPIAPDTTANRAVLGAGEKPRIMGRDTTPADVRAASDALAGDAVTPLPQTIQGAAQMQAALGGTRNNLDEFNELFPPKSANTSIAGSGKPATPQAPLAGVEGKRVEADINGMCANFYQYAKEHHPHLSHEDIHNLFDVKSMKEYFATKWPADARKQLDAMVKAAAGMAQKAG